MCNLTEKFDLHSKIVILIPLKENKESIKKIYLHSKIVILIPTAFNLAAYFANKFTF